jgi:hypothetical protein
MCPLKSKAKIDPAQIYDARIRWGIFLLDRRSLPNLQVWFGAINVQTELGCDAKSAKDATQTVELRLPRRLTKVTMTPVVQITAFRHIG